LSPVVFSLLFVGQLDPPLVSRLTGDSFRLTRYAFPSVTFVSFAPQPSGLSPSPSRLLWLKHLGGPLVVANFPLSRMPREVPLDSPPFPGTVAVAADELFPSSGPPSTFFFAFIFVLFRCHHSRLPHSTPFRHFSSFFASFHFPPRRCAFSTILVCSMDVTKQTLLLTLDFSLRFCSRPFVCL